MRGMRYVGCDVVPAVIESNRHRHARPGVEFTLEDLVTDPLPAGEAAFVRQALQHLSNEQICAILPKLSAYDKVFITEHYPSDDRMSEANLDKVHGGGTRAIGDSAVVLSEPPFSLPRGSLRLLIEAPTPPLAEGDELGWVRTFEYTPAVGGL